MILNNKRKTKLKKKSFFSIFHKSCHRRRWSQVVSLSPLVFLVEKMSLDSDCGKVVVCANTHPSVRCLPVCIFMVS